MLAFFQVVLSQVKGGTFMCVDDIEVCHCTCHNGIGMEHCTPCCTQCPICGQNILNSFYEYHIGRCGKEELPEELKNFVAEKPHTG